MNVTILWSFLIAVAGGVLGFAAMARGRGPWVRAIGAAVFCLSVSLAVFVVLPSFY